jgi:WD40 repeat protein
VSSVIFSPDGQRLATGSTDLTAKIWDVSGVAEVRARGTGPAGPERFPDAHE